MQHNFLLFNGRDNHIIEIIDCLINKSKVKFIPICMIFLIETSKFLQVIRGGNGNDFREILQPSRFCCNYMPLDTPDLVQVAKVFVIIFGCMFTLYYH